jgi:beta-glucanase (GH16 family)
MKDQKLQEFELLVNNERIDSKIGIEGNGWQTSRLKSEKGSLQTVNLNEGKNTISFISKKPEVPEIEFIKLS